MFKTTLSRIALQRKKLKIYECNLPTMLLYFHENKINTSGWITFNKEIKPLNKKKGNQDDV